MGGVSGGLVLDGWCLTGVLVLQVWCLPGPDVARVVSQGVLMLQRW